MTSISKKEIVEMLSCEGRERDELFSHAVDIRNTTVSPHLYLRGLIEFSNICVNDCLYCGIRKSNRNVNRYEYSIDDILASVDLVARAGISSIVLQSGERHDKTFIDNLVLALERIKERHPSMSITLSVGEQSHDAYRALFQAGAERYLLRIESSVKNHYEMLHPDEMSYENRVQCLKDLREIGYQVGTGVMINSPFQTRDNLADDILFFKKLDIDMCGMGPYIPHADTPLSAHSYDGENAMDLGLKMIAVLRFVMPDINIAATTALETLSSQGRELGLMAGANVVMPQFSLPGTRKDYMLYDNKPLWEDDYISMLRHLKEISKQCGMDLDTGDHGTPLHFIRRMNNGSTR